MIELEGVKGTGLIGVEKTWLTDCIMGYTICAFDLFHAAGQPAKPYIRRPQDCDHIVSHN